jgi:shikimate kinase
VKAEKVYLVGFMGCGKSTIARALARRLDWRTIDIDQVIEDHERLPIADIFARHGEPYFRMAERAALTGQLGVRHAVVATGGGTFVDPQNRAMINGDGLSIWLDIPLDRALDRVPADGRRPLATDRDAFERLYHLRRAAYQHAHIRVDAGRQGVDALVEQLMELVAY